MNIFPSAVFVFLVIFVVPIVIYGLFSRMFDLPGPQKKVRFFLGVVVQKVATTLGFVTFFILGIETLDAQWLLYGGVWFLMYAITEVGQVLIAEYSKKEAIAGIVSEAIYFPLAAYVLHVML